MSDEITEAVPVVFISYSHDSDEHQGWVREFATALRNVGVNVILDQWEIGPGDDVPKFMEQSVRKALRVIMVCMEQYVRKADDAKGGAGYEAMVVTGELVGDLGTRKFIPIVRQPSATPVLSARISTRYFVDFGRDDEFAQKLEELARNIQQAPRFEKPPLGKSPFIAAKSQSSAEAAGATQISVPSGPYKIYELSLSDANVGSFSKWRELIHKEKSDVGAAMLRRKAENQQSFPERAKDIPAFLLPGVATHSGLFGAAFRAFDSTDERFHNQLSLLDWIRDPKGWERSGPIVWVEFPELLLFTYQATLGGIGDEPASSQVGLQPGNHPVSRPVFQQRRPASIQDITFCWLARLTQLHLYHRVDVSAKGSQGMGVAVEIVCHRGGHGSRYRRPLPFLDTVDFVSATKAKAEGDAELRGLNPPLFFLRAEGEIHTLTQGVFFGSANFIAEMLSENGITDEALPALWSLWMQSCGKWVAAVYPDVWIGHSLVIPHSDLPRILFRGPQKRRID